MTDGARRDDALLHARVRVPEHVVRRDFPEETVALNLERGAYHGLNPTAAVMVEALHSSASVTHAVGRLTAEFAGTPREVIERDLLELCRTLGERGLVVCDAGDAT